MPGTYEVFRKLPASSVFRFIQHPPQNIFLVFTAGHRASDCCFVIFCRPLDLFIRKHFSPFQYVFTAFCFLLPSGIAYSVTPNR